MIFEILAGAALLFGGYKVWKNRQGIPLVQGQQYAVSFTTPPGQPVSLGTTSWTPVVGHEPFARSYAPNNYVMRATWTGPTNTFFAVNPAVAGPNTVTDIEPAATT